MYHTPLGENVKITFADRTTKTLSPAEFDQLVGKIMPKHQALVFTETLPDGREVSVEREGPYSEMICVDCALYIANGVVNEHMTQEQINICDRNALLYSVSINDGHTDFDSGDCFTCEVAPAGARYDISYWE